jgi:hypothetical protein
MRTGTKIALWVGIPTGCFLILVGGCAALVGSAANEVDKQVQADKKADVRAAKEDVKLLSCKVVNENEFIGPDVKAQVKITNHGDRRASYWVAGEFLDAKGDQVDSLDTYVENLAPGASATRDFAGIFVPGQLDGVTKGTCKILDVSRDEYSAAGN